MINKILSKRELDNYLDTIMSQTLIDAWKTYPDDKLGRRELINNALDFFSKEFDYALMRMDFSKEDLPEDFKFLLEELDEIDLYLDENEEIDLSNDISDELRDVYFKYITKTLSTLACRELLTAEEFKKAFNIVM